MSQDCIFCQIVKGEIPCAKAYATDAVLAFLDIGPVNKGHVLVIPTKHYENLFALPPELGAELVTAMRIVGKAVMEATGAAGLNVGMNNFEAAGQLVPHAHFHLIPRFTGDGLTLWPPGKYESKDEMATLAEAIRTKI
jgi:histidine triad (HIT) family protein